MVLYLNVRFSLKDLGALTYFLGIEVTYLPFRVHLNQPKYISDLLHKLNFQHLNLAPTPSVTSKNLSFSDGELMTDPFVYWSRVGAL